MHINRWDMQTKNCRIDAYQCENIYWAYILNSWKELSEYFCCYCCHCSLRCVCVRLPNVCLMPQNWLYRLVLTIQLMASLSTHHHKRAHGAKAKAFPIMMEFVSWKRERVNVSCKQWHCILMCLFKICWPWPQKDTNREIERERKRELLRWVSVHPII